MASHPGSPSHLYLLRRIIFAGVIGYVHTFHITVEVLSQCRLPKPYDSLCRGSRPPPTALFLLASRCLLILPFAVPFSSTGDMLGHCSVVIHFEVRLHPSSPICFPVSPILFEDYLIFFHLHKHSTSPRFRPFIRLGA